MKASAMTVLKSTAAVLSRFTGKENIMKHVYLVQLNWSTTDYDGVETFLYAEYDDAYSKFKDLITDECAADTSWIGSEVFDEDGEINDDYDVDCCDNNSGEGKLFAVIAAHLWSPVAVQAIRGLGIITTSAKRRKKPNVIRKLKTKMH